MTYAKIEYGQVTNLIEIQPMNAKDYPDCIPVDDRPVRIGDTYADGVFLRDGEKVKNARELLAEAKAENKAAFAILAGKGAEEE